MGSGFVFGFFGIWRRAESAVHRLHVHVPFRTLSGPGEQPLDRGSGHALADDPVGRTEIGPGPGGGRNWTLARALRLDLNRLGYLCTLQRWAHHQDRRRSLD